jgi:predicted SAM-dependent methyltransferase
MVKERPEMMKDFLRRHIPAGVRSSLGHVKGEIKSFVMHRRGLRQAQKLRNQGRLKLHIGCSAKLKKDWLNIDLCPQADMTLDMRERLPFSDDSCSIIYSEHFLEHLDYPDQANFFLKECYRVLEPGGLFSVGVPDTEWPIAEYAGQKMEGYFRIAKERWHPEWCETEMEHINYHFRQGDQHRFAYDFKTLAKALARIGFQEIQRRDFDRELDSADRELGTLYVRASKQKGSATRSFRSV